MAPTQMAKQLISGLTGETVDQDHNAAKNLRYCPELNASTALDRTYPLSLRRFQPLNWEKCMLR